MGLRMVTMALPEDGRRQTKALLGIIRHSRACVSGKDRESTINK